MIKLIGSTLLRCRNAISRLPHIDSSFSTNTQSSSLARNQNLYRRVWRSGDPSISMVTLLNGWLEEGRDVKQIELQRLVKQLRSNRRYTQALQISEWMSDRLDCTLSAGDIAVRLDLIAKVRGVAKAEEYFNTIPSSSEVDDKIHGALLNSYAENNSLDKADDLFQKMRELGFLKQALSYNVMLSLYSRMGKHEKLNVLLHEMEKNGIKCDTYTYAIRLNALAETSDIEGMEKLLKAMGDDPQVSMDIHAYSIASKGYMKLGLLEKALIVIRKAEEQISSKGKRIDYEHLLTLYASVGNQGDVFRIWKRYKNFGKITNRGYLAFLSSLVKLDDFDSLEEVFKEWESGKTTSDNRIVNLLISAYCKKGLFEKGFAYVERLVSTGDEPHASTWQCLANQCCVDGEMVKAVEFMRKAALAGSGTWRLNRFTLAACVEYLRREGDQEKAHEILELIKGRGVLSDDIHRRLINFVNGDKDSGALDAMMGDNEKKDDDYATDEKNT